ncbi:MAG: PTS fructose transporter subunit IIA [Desulfobacterales bacterium]|jgi:PTS system mannose-specific IIA component
MIGIVIVTHSQLGDALIEAAEFIIGKKSEALVSVSIDLNESADVLRAKIAKGIKKVKSKDGVLILTDMFGGTPSNLSYSFLEEGQIEVISGVNLPILIQAVNTRKKMDLDKLAVKLEKFGKKSISLASSILKGNKRS